MKVASDTPEIIEEAFGTIDQRVIDAAVREGLDPWGLDWHLEAEHGWESHDNGYEQAIEIAIQCARRSVSSGARLDECIDE